MKNIFYCIGLISLIVMASCRKDDLVKNSGVKLSFSADTVFLDTVFNAVNSSTYTLKVYNPDREKVIIDNIRLAGGQGSPYRLNVNGKATKNINDVEILGNDSIYIFIEITPSANTSPDLLITDNIIFVNKGTEQDVDLVTLGRQAHFHFPTNFLLAGTPPNQVLIPYSVIKCNDVWLDDMPHVVYGYAVVDEDCELTINPGSEIYFHQNSGLWVFNGGKLSVAPGAVPGLEDSVIFAGDRLEPFYEDIPGQWGGLLGGIFIDDSARANINISVIKNAVTAIRLDSAQFTDQLIISNSYVLNSSRTALFGGFGSVDARNVVIANAGLYGFFGYGGNYEFRHCTFANYWNQSTRTTPNVLLTNFFDFTDENSNTVRVIRPLQKAYFGNCIIYGNNTQELQLEEDMGTEFSYTFNHALLKLDSDEDDRGFDINNPSFINPVVNLDPLFLNTDINNYDLDTTSQARDQGNNIDAQGQNLNLDIKGRIRNGDGKPDLGAFEFPF